MASDHLVGILDQKCAQAKIFLLRLVFQWNTIKELSFWELSLYQEEKSGRSVHD